MAATAYVCDHAADTEQSCRALPAREDEVSGRCATCGTVYLGIERFCVRDGTRLDGPDVENDLTSTAPAPGALAGTILDGRYRIVRKIGEGGMSFVYLASEHAGNGDARTDPAKPLAIKVLASSPTEHGNAMARLRREAALGARLAHRNVCPILGLGETADGLVYVVMPYLEGEILSDVRHRERRLAPDRVARYVVDIAAGLEAAHELGIVHRDLKPENVMIVPDALAPAGERAVVLDFGLAKERRSAPEVKKLTATGIVMGTPEFMSPEQLRGKPLDSRTDIYALALMTYEMLTGVLPFAGRTQQELTIARIRSDPLPLRRARPELEFSEALEGVLLKGMARDRDARYARAREFAEAVAGAVDDDDLPGAPGA